jgi:hypothetical protein
MTTTKTHWIALLLLTGIAWIHYRGIPDKLGETAYLGWSYILLVAGCAASGAWMLSERWRTGYQLGMVISLGALIAYAVTRTTGLPHAMGDIGNWAEPIGVVSLVLEAAFVILAVVQLRRGPVTETTSSSPSDLRQRS